MFDTPTSSPKNYIKVVYLDYHGDSPIYRFAFLALDTNYPSLYNRGGNVDNFCMDHMTSALPGSNNPDFDTGCKALRNSEQSGCEFPCGKKLHLPECVD